MEEIILRVPILPPLQFKSSVPPTTAASSIKGRSCHHNDAPELEKKTVKEKVKITIVEKDEEDSRMDVDGEIKDKGKQKRIEVEEEEEEEEEEEDAEHAERKLDEQEAAGVFTLLSLFAIIQILYRPSDCHL